ncbi:MAG TPA: cytochrome c [Candidatus Kapabacteria bacterium]|nr:cytochrome c [Candidatus Kapabacteria bacterium]
MNFLDKLVIPQPDYNLNMLNALLVLALAVYIIYNATMFGSILLSVFFKRKSKSNEDNSAKTALSYAALVTDKFMYAFGLSIVPFLSIIFIYTQLLHKANPEIAAYLMYAFVLYVIGLALAFLYNKVLATGSKSANDDKSFNLQGINLASYSRFNPYGFISLVFQLLSYWILIASINLASHQSHWANDGFVKMLFSIDSIVDFTQFIIISLSLAAITFLFRNYSWDKKNINGDEVNSSIFKSNLWIALISSILVSTFFAIGIWTLAKQSFSTSIFFASIAGVILVVLSLQWLYVSYRDKKFNLINYAYLAMIIVVFIFAFRDKTAFAVSNKANVVTLNEDYNVHHDEFVASLGLGKKEINGGEIYSGRCVACHRDEDSPTAPAHKNVIKKYLSQADPKAALVKFIMSPVKVNPAYPPMPNPGLTPAEANAVAEFMVSKYSTK